MNKTVLIRPLPLWTKLLIIVAALCPLGMSHAAASKAQRPNIVLIMADDLGYSDLGCYGSEIATPNLDKLAKTGAQFTQFYTTPRCCPTRASLLTGLYPHQAGIGDMMQDQGLPGYRGEINRHTPIIAEELKPAGYQTFMVGKWHTSHIVFDSKRQLNYESDKPYWDNKDCWPLQRGFDDYYGTIHGVCSFFDPFSLVRGNTPIRAEGTNYYYTDAISDQAVANIDRGASAGKPFFLYVAYTAPHWPLQAPEAEIAKYRSTYLAGWDVIRSNRYQRQLELGIIDKSWPLSPRDKQIPDWTNVTEKAWEANRMATHAAMIDKMDQGIGRILAKLREKGVDQNTLVMFLSDNGACAEVIQPNWYDVPSRTRDGLKVKVGNTPASWAGPNDVWQSYGLPWANVSDTPFRLYKHFTHEGGIATPFIAHWPAGITTNTGLTRQVGHITDLMATFLDAAGASHLTNFNGAATIPLEGQSLLPVLAGQAQTRAKPIFWEHEGNRAVRNGQWKLVSRHPGPWELYDIEADRVEAHNLAQQQPDRVAQMSQQYQAWAKRCQVLTPEELSAHRAAKAKAKAETEAD